MFKGQSFPLIFLMLLVALAGILARVLMPLVHAIQKDGLAGSDIGADVLVWWSISLVGMGVVCGVTVGWVRESVVAGLTLGFLLGGLVGAACAPLLLIPASLSGLFDLAWIFISLLLLTGGTILIERRQSKKRSKQAYVEALDETLS